MKLYKYFVMAALAVTGLAATSCGNMDNVIDHNIYMDHIRFTIDGSVNNRGTVAVGETLQLGLNVIPTSATVIDPVWYSEDESIATIDENGLVTGVKLGETKIHVYSAHNPEVEALPLTLKVIGGALNINSQKVDQKDAD